MKDDDDASGMSSKRYRIIFILIFMLMSGAFCETTKQHMTNDMENAQSGKCFHRYASSSVAATRHFAVQSRVSRLVRDLFVRCSRFSFRFLPTVCDRAILLPFAMRRCPTIMTLLLIPLDFRFPSDLRARSSQL